MKIVVLDGYTLNPGDLDWQPLAALGEFHCFDRTSPDELLDRAQGAQVLLTNKTLLDADALRELPDLEYIGVLATGTNVVDLNAASELGIKVTNVPGYGPDAVAQMVFAHILHHTQRLSAHHNSVVAGVWSQAPDFCFTLAPLQSLKGKILGLVGFGDIGRQVANIAKAFQMRVLVNTPSIKHDLPEGVSWCEREALFACADIISLHCPLTSDTEKLINRERLSAMKPNAILINTARGGLVDEQALADALAQGKIAAAGVDVLSSEPPQADNPLLSAPHISISPHNSWATREARQQLLTIAVDNFKGYLAGQPVNLVN
ncbi:D-2-hydroxyacid dehydrogenase [Shewanella rhizosphaerae]|uniref:D-2-hydroxyacid dehydrogenase n=1 Tax=Shewanella rhizosphaerae TaxID=2864207 RepID=UPI001C65AACC|nr:D-2-hydroxyacid dehydrogenase [Shewanella rhizosphaerae]QYK13798.1 D-2-hydroxyacid dehydrogenase [Shewanella rhizosphaerae]